MKWSIGWGTISQCNMNCGFCYSKRVREASEDLKYNDWIKFIDENHQHIDSINYGTGENTLSLDWFKLVNYIKEKYNIKQALTTNGFISERVKDKELEKIFIESISEVDVSLDFANSDMHNSFRGVDTAFEWALKTLELCNKFNKLTTIVFIGTDQTLEIENLQGLFEIASKYNCKLRMNIYRPTQGIDEHNSHYIASFHKIIDALTWISNTYKVLSIDDPLFGSILVDQYNGIDPSGSQSLRILSDGNITPSTYLITDNFIRGNIKDKNVLENLDNRLDFQSLTPKGCLTCEFSSKCKGGVLDRRYLWYKTFDSADPYCPIRNNVEEKLSKIKIVNNDEFTSIHHGYLPTMFFAV